nr:hypothetical protein 5 [Piscirickettsiaceae bacterium]
MNSKNIKELAQRIYQQNKTMGWWEGDVCIYTKLQLISTEIAEATEGERKNLMDDHLPHRKMGEVELADALMRVLDIGQHLELETEYGYDHNIPKEFKTIAAKHLLINMLLAELVEGILIRTSKGFCNSKYGALIKLIIKVANDQGYDIFAALQEKLEYNKHRANHQPQNRAKANGKKF